MTLDDKILPFRSLTSKCHWPSPILDHTFFIFNRKDYVSSLLLHHTQSFAIYLLIILLGNLNYLHNSRLYIFIYFLCFAFCLKVHVDGNLIKI